MTEHLYFAHANGFPACVYQKMLTVLACDHHLTSLDIVGHDPAYPVTDCWPHLVEETIQSIERQATEPVYGIGHSLGGVLLLYAAVARPELFKGLVILDSPLFGRWRACNIWLAKRLGYIGRLTPGGNTLKRRDRWASSQMAFEYFLRKPVFARFDRDCLRDYAEQGTCSDDQGGRRLKFRPVIEHQIFHTLPHDLTRLRNRLRVPAHYVVAGDGGVLNRADLKFVVTGLGMQLSVVPGSHLFPLEFPLEAAAQIQRAIRAMQGAG